MSRPFYVVLAGYALLRLWRGETAVGWKEVAAVFGVLAATLVPVVLTALHLLAEVKAHVIVSHPPTWREFGGAFKFLLLAAGVGAWWDASPSQPRKPAAGSGLFLMLGWWMCQPVALFAFFRFTGENVCASILVSLFAGRGAGGGGHGGLFSPGRILEESLPGDGGGGRHFCRRNSEARAAASQFRMARDRCRGPGPRHPARYADPVSEPFH